MIKILNKSHMEGVYLNIIRKHDKLTANITLNGAKEQDKDDHYPTSIQYTIKIPSTTIRKQIKGIQIKMEEVKLSLFGDNIVLYIRNPTDFTKILLELINKFSNVAGHKIKLKLIINR